VANLTRAALLVASAMAAAGLPGGARAAGVVLKHVISVYADETGQALRRPEGVACNDDGQIVVADTGNRRLVSFTFKGQGVLGGRAITTASLQSPTAVQLGGGEILALDGKSRAIERFDAKGQHVGAMEPKGLPEGAAPVIAAFKVGAGALYLLDGAGKAVLVADAAGNVTRSIPLPAGKGPFTDVAADGAGTVFVVDPASASVWAAGKDAKAFTPVNETLGEAASYPASLATDAQGNLFVVDRNGGSLYQLGSDGRYQARHLTFGWDPGQLQYPIQICVTSDFLVVADRGNQRVQVFQVLR
jgi:DNA-binding beta-propeller fold protein YncE